MYLSSAAPRANNYLGILYFFVSDNTNTNEKTLLRNSRFNEQLTGLCKTLKQPAAVPAALSQYTDLMNFSLAYSEPDDLDAAENSPAC